MDVHLNSYVAKPVVTPFGCKVSCPWEVTLSTWGIGFGGQTLHSIVRVRLCLFTNLLVCSVERSNPT